MKIVDERQVDCWVLQSSHSWDVFGLETFGESPSWSITWFIPASGTIFGVGFQFLNYNIYFRLRSIKCWRELSKQNGRLVSPIVFEIRYGGIDPFPENGWKWKVPIQIGVLG